MIFYVTDGESTSDENLQDMNKLLTVAVFSWTFFEICVKNLKKITSSSGKGTSRTD